MNQWILYANSYLFFCKDQHAVGNQAMYTQKESPTASIDNREISINTHRLSWGGKPSNG